MKTNNFFKRLLWKSHTYNKFRRLIYSYCNKELSDNFDPYIFDKIYRNNYWESDESLSGYGSTIEATKTIREFLPAFFEKYHIKSMLDIPCGDFNWMKTVPKNDLKYFGADIVTPLIFENKKYSTNNINFEILDITKDELPTVDLIFCKDCIQHLSQSNIIKAINNIKKSKSTYLLITSYPLTLRNWNIREGSFCAVNLQKKPFLFPKPILSVKEESNVVGVELDKTMCLWRICDLPDYSV